MPAYHVSYRGEIVETQGLLFGRVGREHPDADGLDFMESYLRGRTRGFIDRAEAILDAYPGLHDLSLPLAVERCLPTNTPSVPTERNEP